MVAGHLMNVCVQISKKQFNFAKLIIATMKWRDETQA